MIFHRPQLTRSLFATDFGEYPIGDELKDHGWTEQGVTGTTSDATYTITSGVGSLSGRSTTVDQGVANQYRAITWDLLSTVTDCEILAMVKLVDLPNSTGGGGVTRVDGSSNGHDATFSSSGSPDKVRISKFTAGVFVGEDAAQSLTLDTATWYWLRYRVSSTTFSIKCWADGDAEPAFTSGTSATYTSGKLGLQTVEAKRFRVAWFAAVDGPGTAPGPQG